MSEVLKAILWLTCLSQSTAETYSQQIQTQAERKGLDPLLVVAEIHLESRFRAHVHSKRNYGLMQVRVSPTVNPDLIGKERKLFRSGFNIARGAAMLRYWRKYHERTCHRRSRHPPHPWWSHYQHGRRVRSAASGERVRKLYERLKRKFRTPPGES